MPLLGAFARRGLRLSTQAARLKPHRRPNSIRRSLLLLHQYTTRHKTQTTTRAPTQCQAPTCASNVVQTTGVRAPTWSKPRVFLRQSVGANAWTARGDSSCDSKFGAGRRIGCPLQRRVGPAAKLPPKTARVVQGHPRVGRTYRLERMRLRVSSYSASLTCDSEGNGPRALSCGAG